MKKSLLIFITLCVAVSFCQAQMKIATVNMSSCFDGYWKYKKNKKKIEDSIKQAKDDLKDREDALKGELDQMEKEIKELQEAENNPALTKDAQKAKLTLAEEKKGDYQKKLDEYRQYRSELQQSFEKRIKTNRDMLVDEIRKVALDVAKKKGINLLLDTSDVIGQGVPPVIYADPSWDITEDVLKAINADAPKEEEAAATK